MSDDEDMPQDDAAGGEGWIVSYADLMTLLFAAFVVMYGIKPEGRSMEILGVVSRIREAFVDVPDIIPEEEATGPIKEGMYAFKFFKGDQMNRPVIKKYKRNTHVENVINEDISRLRSLINMMKITPIHPKTGKPEGRIIEEDEQGFRLRLFATYFFSEGEYRLKREAEEKVRRIGMFLKELDRPITIEGHSDGTPSEGRDAWEISALRATYVAKVLRSELDFPMDKLRITGYGDQKPMTENETPHGRAMNRRLEIKVEYGE